MSLSGCGLGVQPVNHFYTPDSSGIVASSGIRKSGMKTAIGTKSELCCFRLFHTINEIALKSMDENHVTTTTQHSLGLTCFSRDRTITYLPVAIAWSIFRRMHRLCGNWKGVGSVAVGQRSRWIGYCAVKRSHCQIMIRTIISHDSRLLSREYLLLQLVVKFIVLKSNGGFSPRSEGR
jgi:hypothetical protein